MSTAKPYASLPALAVEGDDITFHQPVLEQLKPVRLEDPAVEVMTDFKRIRAITVAPDQTLEFAYQRMISNRVRMLLVVDQRNTLLGLITSTDAEGDKPLRLMNERGIKRGELLVSDVMTPRDRLEAIEFADLQRARVGDVAATLEAAGRHHVLVADRDDQGKRAVRGLFSASQVAKQLGTPMQIVEIAQSFSQVTTLLAH